MMRIHVILRVKAILRIHAMYLYVRIHVHVSMVLLTVKTKILLKFQEIFPIQLLNCKLICFFCMSYNILYICRRLEKNRITEIPPKVFIHLKKLRRLYVKILF